MVEGALIQGLTGFILYILGNQEVGVGGKWKHCAFKNVGVSEETLALTSDLIGRKVCRTVK